jgi:hypothetical protein
MSSKLLHRYLVTHGAYHSSPDPPAERDLLRSPCGTQSCPRRESLGAGAFNPPTIWRERPPLGRPCQALRTTHLRQHNSRASPLPMPLCLAAALPTSVSSRSRRRAGHPQCFLAPAAASPAAARSPPCHGSCSRRFSSQRRQCAVYPTPAPDNLRVVCSHSGQPQRTDARQRHLSLGHPQRPQRRRQRQRSQQ